MERIPKQTKWVHKSYGLKFGKDEQWMCWILWTFGSGVLVGCHGLPLVKERYAQEINLKNKAGLGPVQLAYYNVMLILITTTFLLIYTNGFPFHYLPPLDNCL